MRAGFGWDWKRKTSLARSLQAWSTLPSRTRSPLNPQPSTLDTSSRFLPSSLLGFLFFPLALSSPRFPLCFLYIFICSRPRQPAAAPLVRLARCCPPFVSAAFVWRRVICWPSARQLSNCDHQAPPPQRLLGFPPWFPSLCDCQTGQHHPPEGSRVFRFPSNKPQHWTFLRHPLSAVSSVSRSSRLRFLRP